MEYSGVKMVTFIEIWIMDYESYRTLSATIDWISVGYSIEIGFGVAFQTYIGLIVIVDVSVVVFRLCKVPVMFD